MEATAKDSILALMNVLNTGKVREVDKNGLKFALKIAREYAAGMDEKSQLMDDIGNLYTQYTLFDDHADFHNGYNAAIRAVLNIMDPNQERYKKYKKVQEEQGNVNQDYKYKRYSERD